MDQTLLERVELPKLQFTDVENPLAPAIMRAYMEFNCYVAAMLIEKITSVDTSEKHVDFVKSCVKKGPFFVKRNLESGLLGLVEKWKFVRTWGSSVALPFAFQMTIPYLQFFEDEHRDLCLTKQVEESQELIEDYFHSIGLRKNDAHTGTRLFGEYTADLMVSHYAVNSLR